MSPKQSTELQPVHAPVRELELIEKRIKAAFRYFLYEPLLRELSISRVVLDNARTPLLDAIRSGRVKYERGKFSGKFSAGVSKELRELGAEWDRHTATYRLGGNSLPRELREAIALSEFKFQRKLLDIDHQLTRQDLLEKIADRLSMADLFDSTIWRVEKDLKRTVGKLAIMPELSTDARRRIADEWQGNMDLWIKGFAAEEIEALRLDIAKSVHAGSRFESVVRSIQKSYGVTASKAKFLARQETNLLVTKLKETRYTEAGVLEYRWRTVVGSKHHPVRPSHKILDGKVFRWDAPPVTTPPGEAARRNNPGQDFNCRCTAIPVVRFKRALLGEEVE